MTTYAGNPLSFPASYPRISDVTPPTGSDLNVPLECDADRTAFLARCFRQFGAQNWGPKVTPAIDSGLALWDAAKRKWWLLTDCVTAGSNGKIYYSLDSGQTWTYVGSTVSGFASAAVPVVGDFDTSGNGVVGMSSAPSFGTHDDASCWDCTAGAWTYRSVAALGVDGAAAGAHYDPIHAKWCITQLKVSGTAIVAATSTNRTTWSAATMPASLASGFVTACSAIRKDTGRIVLVANRSTDSKIYFVSSDDGGATFADLVSFARPANIAKFSLAFDAVRSAWVCTMLSTAGTTYTYTSTNNGTTWTQVSALTSNRIQSIVALEGVLIGYAADSSANQFAVFSDDGGATWRPGFQPFASSGSGWGVFAGGGQVLALSGPDVFPSRRFGGSGEVLT